MTAQQRGMSAEEVAFLQQRTERIKNAIPELGYVQCTPSKSADGSDIVIVEVWLIRPELEKKIAREQRVKIVHEWYEDLFSTIAFASSALAGNWRTQFVPLYNGALCGMRYICDYP